MFRIKVLLLYFIYYVCHQWILIFLLYVIVTLYFEELLEFCCLIENAGRLEDIYMPSFSLPYLLMNCLNSIRNARRIY